MIHSATPKRQKHHVYLTDLIDGLGRVVHERLARNPVVLTQLHDVLKQEADPSRQLLAVHQAIHPPKVLIH